MTQGWAYEGDYGEKGWGDIGQGISLILSQIPKAQVSEDRYEPESTVE